MSDNASPETLDILAMRVLAKAELLNTQEVFQEQYSTAATPLPLGTKAPLNLYIVNDGSSPDTKPDHGSPVKCVKLCKRILAHDPRNTVICTQKSRVTIDFALVLIVEFENGSFDVMTLPKNLSYQGAFTAGTTKAFVDLTVLNDEGTPVIQNQNKVQPYETFAILGSAGAYTDFEYAVSIPLSSFDHALRKCELDDPSLQSYILLRNLKYNIDVLGQVQVLTGPGQSPKYVWTTQVQFSLFEDIIDKLGIAQDIEIQGTPEYVCQDGTCTC